MELSQESLEERQIIGAPWSGIYGSGNDGGMRSPVGGVAEESTCSVVALTLFPSIQHEPREREARVKKMSNLISDVGTDHGKERRFTWDRAGYMLYNIYCIYSGVG